MVSAASVFLKLIQQKSLEWTNERGILFPTQMSTQGSLSVSPKKEVVNKVIL